jgi:hypothetical protein
MEFKEKVSAEVARQEVEKWLGTQRILPKKREALAAQIDTIVEHLMYGSMHFNEDGELTYVLAEPIKSDDGSVVLSELKFKKRIRVAELQAQTKNVAPEDADGRVIAYLAALTGVPKGLFPKLDISDYSVAQSITLFFV